MNDTDLIPFDNTEKYEGVDPQTDLDALDRRDYRARTALMVVIPEEDSYEKATGVYTVITESATAYSVTLRVGDDPSCTCPDWQNRQPAGGCKHIRRVMHEGADAGLPAEDVPTGDFWALLDERMTAIGNRLIEHETRAAELRSVMHEALANMPESRDFR